MSSTYRNAPLRRILARDLEILRPHLRPVDLPVRTYLAHMNKPIEDVYFLESGIASTTVNVPHELPVEIGITGRDGVVNLPVVMGSEQTPTSTFMQIAGAGHAAPADVVRAAMLRSPALSLVLLQAAHVFMTQLSSTVLANGRATLAERLSRWLLMAADRQDDYWVPLTHEFLSIMIGVRRAGVTTTLRDLEGRGLVRRSRGGVELLDRPGLIAISNGYYGVAELEFERLFGDATSGSCGAVPS